MTAVQHGEFHGIESANNNCSRTKYLFYVLLATSSCRGPVNETATGLSLSPHPSPQAAGRAEAAAVDQYFSSSTRDVIFSPSFYSRDDILARVRVLAMARCLCLSVTSWCSTKTAGRIELMFGMEPDISSISVRVCFNEIQIPVVLNSGLTKFRHGLSIV